MLKKMKQKKHTSTEEKVVNPIQETDNITDNNVSEQADIQNDLVKKYTEEEYQLKVNELNDKYLRLYSEFDNFRKRTLKEKIDLSRTASEEIIKDILPVIDDFDRAIKSFDTTDKIEAVKEGIQLIYGKMKGILTSKGLQEMKTIGIEFNTDFHEAITSIPAPSEEMKNKVIDEIQKGYLLNDKVIRFAKVVTGQ